MNPEPTPSTTRRTSKCTLLLVMWGFVSILILHAIEPTYTLTNNFVSEYARSDHWYLMTIAFVVLGLSAICLSKLMGDLKLDKPFCWLVRPVPILGSVLWPLLLAGICVGLLAAFPTDTDNAHWWRPGAAEIPSTLVGKLHGIFTVSGFALAIVSMLAFTLEFDFAPRTRWTALKVPNFFLICFMLPSLIAHLLLLVLAQSKIVLGVGFTERLLIFSFIAWIIMVDCAYLMHPRHKGRGESSKAETGCPEDLVHPGSSRS